MSWEVRDGCRRYYYRSRKVAGKVRRQYFGTGPIAQLAAAEDEQRRTERQAHRRLVCEQQQRLGAAETEALELHDHADLIARAALLAGGFHRHARGEWRGRRNGRHA
jgi:hypothetical protein